VLDFPVDPENPPEKRSYRLQWYLAWLPGDAAAVEAEADAAGWAQTGSSCFKAAAAQRLARKLVRSASAPVALAWEAAALCGDPAHLERPGKGELLHFDRMERARFFLWANRQLGRRACSFHWAAPMGGADSVLAQVLNRPPSGGFDAPE